MSNKDKRITDTPSTNVGPNYGLAEVITIGIIWGFGFASLWLVTSNYHGDQSVSLENSIAYIMIAIVLVSGGVLFRDTIASAITRWVQRSHTED